MKPFFLVTINIALIMGGTVGGMVWADSEPIYWLLELSLALLFCLTLRHTTTTTRLSHRRTGLTVDRITYLLCQRISRNPPGISLTLQLVCHTMPIKDEHCNLLNGKHLTPRIMCRERKEPLKYSLKWHSFGTKRVPHMLQFSRGWRDRENSGYYPGFRLWGS